VCVLFAMLLASSFMWFENARALYREQKKHNAVEILWRATVDGLAAKTDYCDSLEDTIAAYERVVTAFENEVDTYQRLVDALDTNLTIQDSGIVVDND